MATVGLVNPAQRVLGVLHLGLVRRRHLRLRAMQLAPHALAEERRRSRRVKREPAGEIAHARLHGSRGRDGAQALQHGYLLYPARRAARRERHDRGRPPSLRPKAACDACRAGERIRDCTKLSQLSPESFSMIRPATTNIRLLYRQRVRGGPLGSRKRRRSIELVAREWGLVPEEIVPRQSAPVREQIPRRHGRRRHRICERKIGKVRADRRVERDPSLVGEQRDRRCRERLRAGAEREQRVGRDRQPTARHRGNRSRARRRAVRARRRPRPRRGSGRVP